MQIKLILLLSLLTTASIALAQNDILGSNNQGLSAPGLLPVDVAFSPEAAQQNSQVELRWTIRPGYYLYRKQFRVLANGEPVKDIHFSAGEIHDDPYFGQKVEIYHKEAVLTFPVKGTERLEVRFQGCAEAGYCYPPHWVALEASDQRESVRYLGLIDGPGGQMTEGATDMGNVFLPALLTLLCFAVLTTLGIALGQPGQD